VKTSIYLTINKRGISKMTKERPSLSQDERAVRLNISVPDAVFAAPPILDADLEVPASALVVPEPEKPLEVEIWPDP
jgi:hypothetical protein